MSDIALARIYVEEARAARMGLGHWANVSPAVRRDNARSHLMMAARVRRGEQ